MRSNYTVHQTPQFKVVSESQLEELHLATLEILRRTGVDVRDEQARELLKKAGAKVDGTRARIPAHLVEWAIRAAPPRVVLSDRNGDPVVYLEDGKGYYGTGSDCLNIMDPYTGERRRPVKADVVSVAKICDALPNIDFVMCLVLAQNVTESISDLHHFEAMVNNTKKPIVFTAWNVDNLKAIVEMAELVAGGADALRLNPFVTLYLEPISPLELALEPTQKLLYMAQKGLPSIWAPGQSGGATSPTTLAGCLAQGNAEALSGLVLAQLRREGAPVIYGGATLWTDMATGMTSFSAPEYVLSVAAWADLAHYYKLPVWSYAGTSDSKAFDQEAAFVSTVMTLVAALSGGNLIHDIGFLETGLTASLEAIVANDELIGMIKHLMQGIEVSEETLALDTIHRVGPGGSFFAEDHTYRHFKENWYPKLFDRGSYDSWVEKGKKTLGQRANDRVREILETHVPEPLPEEVKQGLAAIIEKAEAKARKAG